MKSLWWVLVIFGAVAAGIVWFGGAGAEAGPEPIAYGKDTCARCRMHLARPGFAGQLRDRAGVIKKYDDLGCLLLAMDSAHAEVPEVWVEHHPSGELGPLLTANFVVDSNSQTPMGYGVLAFRDLEAASAHVRDHGGRTSTLEELLKDQRRFNARPTAPGAHPAHGDAR